MTKHTKATPEEVITGLRYLEATAPMASWTSEIIDEAIDLIQNHATHEPAPNLETQKWLLIGDGIAHTEIYCSLQCCLEMLHASGYFETEGITSRAGAKAEIQKLTLRVDANKIHHYIDQWSECDNNTRPTHATHPKI